MKYLFFVFGLLIVGIGGCALTETTSDIPPEEGVILQNRRIDHTSMFFASIDGEVLKPGINTKGKDAKFVVPPGFRNILLRVLYGKSLSTKPLMGAFSGFQIDLVKGSRYFANANIEKGIASIWIEDEHGVRQSEINREFLSPVQIDSGPIFIPFPL